MSGSFSARGGRSGMPIRARFREPAMGILLLLRQPIATSSRLLYLLTFDPVTE